MPERAHYALRFISGKYQGGEFPLIQNREIVIGRSNDLDMVLVEDMVSRRHAKITVTDADIFIQDLGSTNGTFVNGEKVSTSQLCEGDRILVGTNILKVVGIGEAQVDSEAARKRLEATRQSTQGRPMSGVIEEIPLPDLLQLLSTSRKTGALTIGAERGTCRIYLREGHIYYAAIDENFAGSPYKALFRCLTWTSGNFDFTAGAEVQAVEEVAQSTEALLMEGMRQMDEYQKLVPHLPSEDAQLAVPTPLAGRLRDLSPVELDTFQLVLDHGSWRGVLDHHGGTDLDAATSLVELMRLDFVIVP